VGCTYTSIYHASTCPLSRNIHNATAVFIFNVTNRELLGLYEAASQGGKNLRQNAWSGNKFTGAAVSPFPAQVEFRSVKTFRPLLEAAFRHVFPDGKHTRRLNAVEVRHLIALFRGQQAGGKPVVPGAVVPTESEVPIPEAHCRSNGPGPHGVPALDEPL
jgi:hypothetical protein